MPVLRYVGPHDEVEIPSIGVTVKRGDTFETTDEAAEGLLIQTENYASVRPSKAKES